MFSAALALLASALDSALALAPALALALARGLLGLAGGRSLRGKGSPETACCCFAETLAEGRSLP
eukprot:545689-Pyramimonas_sp.AAC.1